MDWSTTEYNGVFQGRSKLHEPEGRVQCEKLTSVFVFFRIHEKPYRYLFNNIHMSKNKFTRSFE